MQNNNTTKVVESYTKSLKELTKLSTDELIVEVLECFLKIERKEFLKHASGDKGNGYYPKAFQGISKDNLQLRIPRTRVNGFKPALLEIVKRDEELVKELALDLYTVGVSSRDTEKVLDRYFSKQLSHTTIVNLSNEYEKARLNWEKKKLREYYKVVFVDAMYIPLRRLDRYAQEAILIAVGMTEDNKREILAFEVMPTEGATLYEEMFRDIKERGTKRIDLVVGDGLKGLGEAIQRVYSKTGFQECTVHKKRNILNKVRTKDKEEIAKDLRKVFELFDKEETEETGDQRIEDFLNKWKEKYPTIGRQFKDRRYLFTYTNFDPEIRRYIYTTNSLENMNSRIRKAMRNKLSFKSEKGLRNYLFLVMMEYEEGVLMKHEVNQFRRFKKCYAKTQFS